MIFNNYTMDELANEYLDAKDKKQPSALLRIFYNDLKSAFNKKKEKNEISYIYNNFNYKKTITCKKLFELNKNNL